MRTADWRAAARTHVSGQFDVPAASIARWPADLTTVVVDRVIRRVRERPSPAPDDSARNADRDDDGAVLANGLLLHTDIAISEQN